MGHLCALYPTTLPLQLPEGAIPPRAATLRVYPLAVNEGVVYVWMGEDPWEEGAKDILPIPSTPDHLDENKVRTIRALEMALFDVLYFLDPRSLETQLVSTCRLEA